MTTIASRDLRNHTASVLKQVADGAEVTVTLHGEPVALITRPRRARRSGMPRAEFLELQAGQSLDDTLAADLAWITDGTTDDLGPVR
ncbi:type II toxin-antitoxin system Phd/YefM family antitoxin [Georgenia subflava]|uniref:Antitoxin n=1 Tax=Georgenia subflava TaxID=1622177 RepID=A0A6N7EM04_9MICO|nr:type II toxin-antitoxin system prevent-host-death family antitoxin [Georgenia subflava]MPV38103.1 type II toxin-antitoxin system prevent-host-death family antitoxin [Georgenia subflava]